LFLSARELVNILPLYYPSFLTRAETNTITGLR